MAERTSPVERLREQVPDTAGISEWALDVKGFEADSRIGLAQVFVRNEDFRKAIDLLKEAQEFDRRYPVDRYIEDLERFLKRSGGG